MPALEMAQETGKLLRWLKHEGEPVMKGEPVMEIETDKVTVEIESPASGILAGISLNEGESVPVGQIVAWIVAPGEQAPAERRPLQSGRTPTVTTPIEKTSANSRPAGAAASPEPITASPVAAQIAREHGIDLALIKPNGGRIEKSDVLAFVQKRPRSASEAANNGAGVVPASPKARRLAAERGIDLTALTGSGPNGAIIAADLPQVLVQTPGITPEEASISTVWRLMAERMTASWAGVPHFYLAREINASALVEMRARVAPLVEKRNNAKPTFTDLLVKLIAATLSNHPRVNASSTTAGYRFNDEINIGIAVAVEDGLIVPVIHHADRLSIGEIAALRTDLVQRATDRKLRPGDISGGTFTLTNLGMYNVDAFSAIVNSPQAAILAVGRITDRVVPIDGTPMVRPMMMATLSCDHRVIDGARAARFLDDLVRLIEEPWGLIA